MFPSGEYKEDHRSIHLSIFRFVSLILALFPLAITSVPYSKYKCLFRKKKPAPKKHAIKKDEEDDDEDEDDEDDDGEYLDQGSETRGPRAACGP